MSSIYLIMYLLSPLNNAICKDIPLGLMRLVINVFFDQHHLIINKCYENINDKQG